MIIERYGFFGGIITQSMIGTIAWYRYAKTIEAGEILFGLEQRAKQEGASIDVLGNVKNKEMVEILEKEGLMVDGKATYEILDTKMFKFVLDEMIQEAGVIPLLHCSIVQAIIDGKKIKGVITESKSGRQAIIAKRVIDGHGVAIIPTTGRYFQVPYGIILPQKVENLLVAGRCVAGDRISHAATRQMVCCAVTGQGAGTATAISITDNVMVRNVDIYKVQNALVKQGVRIE